jgi:hypothetical protein
MIRRIGLLLVSAGLLPFVAANPANAQGPAYHIVLRSRNSDVTPERNRDGQTTGGFVEVVQRTPESFLVVMRGAVIAGSEQNLSGTAAMQFVLNQDFEIVPTRAGVRPPRLALSGQLIGTLESTQPAGGNAEQAPACAAINAAAQPLLNLCIKPHQVSSCQHLFINQREGAYEAVVAPGGYCLHQTFGLNANAPSPAKCAFPRIVPAAAAVFDIEPKVEGRWNYALHTFRTVPHGDFGFSVLVQVVEDPLPSAAPAPHKAD